MLYQQIGGNRRHLGIGLVVVDQQEWQAPLEQEPDLPRLADGVGHPASGELVGQPRFDFRVMVAAVARAGCRGRAF